MKTSDQQLKQAYDFCQQLAKSHYENFPVASILLPKRLRKPISIIYAFARTADDFADEGDEDQLTRLQQLEDYSQALQQISTQNYHGSDPIFIALADVINKHDLPISLFDDLLSAFKQDVVKNRYATFNEVLDYCARSANPVGRLLLHLNGNPSDEQLKQSDKVCTALQLINFYQDIVQDVNESNRIYIPTEELEKFRVAEDQLTRSNTDTTELAHLLRLQYTRAQQLMTEGYKLGNSLNGRLGWEVRAMILGGIVTLNKLMAQKDNRLLTRPRLPKLMFAQLMFLSRSKTLFKWRTENFLLTHI